MREASCCGKSNTATCPSPRSLVGLLCWCWLAHRHHTSLSLSLWSVEMKRFSVRLERPPPAAADSGINRNEPTQLRDVSLLGKDFITFESPHQIRQKKMRFEVGEKVEIRINEFSFQVGMITARREDLQIYCVSLHQNINKIVAIDKDSHIRLPTTENSMRYYCECWSTKLPCQRCDSSSRK